MSTELREAIQSAMKGEEQTEEVETPEVEVETPAETVEEAAKEEKVEAEPKEGEEKKTAAEGRDEKGRFAAKQKAEADAKAAAEGKPPPVAAKDAQGKPAPVAAAEQIKPPQSWTPAAREEWAKVPPAVQREIAKREKDTAVALQQGAEARRFGQEFAQVVNPYMGMIAAAGSNPLQSVSRLLQTAAALRTEPGPTKARIVADLIKQYGVPIEALADALDGVAPPAGQQRQPAPPHDPRVDQMLAERQQEQRARAQQSQQQVAQQIHAFAADPKNEFFNDVQQDMADVIALAQKRGVAITLKEAYDRACSLHPEISTVLSKRQAAAKPAAGSTQRSKAAASSVRGTPAAGVKPTQPDDLRSTIKASMAAANGR